MGWLYVIAFCSVGMYLLDDKKETKQEVKGSTKETKQEVKGPTEYSRSRLFRWERNYVPTGADLRNSQYTSWEKQGYDYLMRTDPDFNYEIRRCLRIGYDIEEAIVKVCEDQGKHL